MKALVLIQSPRIDTYVNVFAAICKQYPDIAHIEILYIKDDEFVTADEIKSQLHKLSEESSFYKKANFVQLTDKKILFKDLKYYIKNWNIVDVSGLSKELSLSVATMAVSYKNTQVCMLNWLKQFNEGEKWIISENNHQYINLLNSSDLSLLRKDYFQKKYVIRTFSGIFGTLGLLIIIKMIYPSFFIPTVIVNVFGLVIGVSGLYLASVSLKTKY